MASTTKPSQWHYPGSLFPNKLYFMLGSGKTLLGTPSSCITAAHVEIVGMELLSINIDKWPNFGRVSKWIVLGEEFYDFINEIATHGTISLNHSNRNLSLNNNNQSLFNHLIKRVLTMRIHFNSILRFLE